MEKETAKPVAEEHGLSANWVLILPMAVCPKK